MGKRKPGLVMGAVFFLWLFAVAAGLGALAKYANRPGQVGQTQQLWPRQTQIHPAEGAPTLVVFLHPKCGCSSATVDELDTLMARTGAKAKVFTVFVQPRGWSPDEVRGSLWKQASSIPGVTALIDADGQEARHFGAKTSGHALLYNEGGALRFSGGITPSRGHEGENEGLRQAVEVINGGGTGRVVAGSKVFGCALFSTEETVHGS